MDRCIDFIKLAKWAKDIFVMPLVNFPTRTPDSRITSSTIPSAYPLILLHLSASVNPGHTPPVTAHAVHGGIAPPPPPIWFDMLGWIA